MKIFFPLISITCLLLSQKGIAQNVGIGTKTPQATLDIRGNQRIGGAAKFIAYDSVSGKISWTGSSLFVPVSQYLMQHSASAEGLFYNSGQLEYRNQLGNPVFFTNWQNGNGYFNGSLGIGTTNPAAKLDVSGSVKVNSLIITSGGSVSDFLIKSNATGDIGFRQGYAGLGLNYIIAVQGAYPSPGPPVLNGVTYLGEIKLITGNVIPAGWAPCHGQLLLINVANADLFSLIGTLYGGDGVNNFALPDLRGAIPVGTGANWQLGDRSN